jgi:hypothetical protein
MKWGHALTRSTDPRTGEVGYGIREIYFDDDPERPDSWTERPVEPVGETVTELLEEIRRFEHAAQNPRVFDVDTCQWVPVPAEPEPTNEETE